MSVKCLLLCVILLLSATASALAAPEVMDAYWRPDQPFPDFARFWGDSTGPDSEVKRQLGGTLHIYLRNTGDQPLTIGDASLEGFSLKQAIAYSDQRKFKGVAYAASIYFSKLPVADREKLIALGEPVWWKAEPGSVKPGESAQIIIRMRRTPPRKAVRVGLSLANGPELSVTVPVGDKHPSIVGAGFPTGLDQVCLYFRHPEKGEAPSTVLMDGVDITAQCSIGIDPNLDTAPVVAKLKAPLARGSFHCFQGVYADGSKATAGLRAFDDDLGYGLWGAKPGKEDDLAVGREHVLDMGTHCINVQMPILGSAAVAKFMSTEEGVKLMDTLGIRRLLDEPEKSQSRFAFYLADEPDTADFKVKDVPGSSKVGCLGQGLLERAYSLREIDPLTPNMVNVNMTFKPDNWYTYGQLPDYFAADPYYQTRLAEAYWKKPNTIPMYSKCTFVNAVASICSSACAPNPLHIMLNSTCRQTKERKFRFGTREEKRIEAYYALAAGAKQISYWWFLPSKPGTDSSNGCGADDPAAKALWNEIGLLGAEIRTAGPIIERSCPIALDVKASGKLWVRTLAAGTNTLVALCVNDDYTNDDKGTNIQPVTNAEVGIDLPSWLKPVDVFEIDCKGTHDVTWQGSDRLNVSLGTLKVTRMIVITSDKGLRASTQKLYDAKFAANVSKLLAGS